MVDLKCTKSVWRVAAVPVEQWRTCGVAAHPRAVGSSLTNSSITVGRNRYSLVNSGKDGKSETVISRFNQETLAETIGVTGASIGFFMRRVGKSGLLGQ